MDCLLLLTSISWGYIFLLLLKECAVITVTSINGNTINNIPCVSNIVAPTIGDRFIISGDGTIIPQVYVQRIVYISFAISVFTGWVYNRYNNESLLIIELAAYVAITIVFFILQASYGDFLDTIEYCIGPGGTTYTTMLGSYRTPDDIRGYNTVDLMIPYLLCYCRYSMLAMITLSIHICYMVFRICLKNN